MLFSCAGKKPEEKKNGAQAGAATRDPVGARRAALSVLGSAVYAQCTEGIVPCVTRLWPSLSPPRRGHGPRAACPHQRPGSSCVGRTAGPGREWVFVWAFSFCPWLCAPFTASGFLLGTEEVYECACMGNGFFLPRFRYKK